MVVRLLEAKKSRPGRATEATHQSSEINDTSVASDEPARAAVERHGRCLEIDQLDRPSRIRKYPRARQGRCPLVAGIPATAGMDRPVGQSLDVAHDLQRRRRAAARLEPYTAAGDRDPLDRFARHSGRSVTLVNDRVGQFMFLRGGAQAREILATLGIEPDWSSSGGWRVRKHLRSDLYAAADLRRVRVYEVATRRRDRVGGGHR